jgi:hypothetical protein
MSTEAPLALRADACPEPEKLAAYIDGTLTPAERTLVDQHLLTCADCREIIADSVAVLEALDREKVPAPAPTPIPPPWRRPFTLWAGVSVALAAAAAIVIAVRVQQRSPYYVPEMGDLVEAVGTSRPIEPRLVGGFGYGPPPQRTRGEGPKTPIAITAAAARVADRASQRSSPESRAAIGVASLFMGDSGAAVSALEDAVAAQPQNARMLSDLAAAYLVRGSASDATRALDAAEHATRLPDPPVEAWFNRALALEALGAGERARQAWQEYLQHDPQSAWADEARRRLGQAPRTTGRAEWTHQMDATLAAADPGELDRLVELRPDFARDYADAALLQAEQTAARRAATARLGRIIRSSTGDQFFEDAARLADDRNTDAARVRFALVKSAYDNDRIGEAASDCAALQPVFEHEGDPYRLWCLFYGGVAAYYDGKLDAARDTFAALERDATTLRYDYLAARAAWMDGLCRTVAADLSGAEADYERALHAFEALRDPIGIASMRQSLAETERLLGDRETAWLDVQRALAVTPQLDSARTLQRLWAGTLVACLTDQQPYAAAAIEPSLRAAATAWGRPAGIVDALRLQTQTCTAIGDDACALRATSEMRAAQDQIADATLRRRSELNVVLAEGQAAVSTQPARAVAAASQAIDLLDRLGGERLAQAHLLRARAYARNGQSAAAELDYRDGIEIFERRRRDLTTEQVRISYFDESWNLFDELLRLQLARGDVDGALVTAERARARALADWIPGVSSDFSVDAFQSRVPAATTFVYYVVADTNIYVWAIHHGGRSFSVIADPDRHLQRETARFRGDLERGLWADAQRETAEDLFDRLLRPAGLGIPFSDHLVISPHGFLISCRSRRFAIGAMANCCWRRPNCPTAPAPGWPLRPMRGPRGARRCYSEMPPAISPAPRPSSKRSR